MHTFRIFCFACFSQIKPTPAILFNTVISRDTSKFVSQDQTVEIPLSSERNCMYPPLSLVYVHGSKKNFRFPKLSNSAIQEELVDSQRMAGLIHHASVQTRLDCSDLTPGSMLKPPEQTPAHELQHERGRFVHEIKKSASCLCKNYAAGLSKKVFTVQTISSSLFFMLLCL